MSTTTTTMQIIDPMQYIVEHMPTPEPGKNASEWFKTERMELNFGEYAGRPDENATMHRQTLAPLLADGWYVTEVSNGGSDGEWKRVSTTTRNVSTNELANEHSTESQESTGTAKENAKSRSQSEADQHSDTQSQSNAYNHSFTSSTETHGENGGYSDSQTNGDAQNSSTGTSDNHGSTIADGTSESESQESARGTAVADGQSSAMSTTEDSVVQEDGGGPYWSAWQRIRLERRRMQAELVLKSMIDSFVNAYNEGRKINVERYDELVALYALMATKTQEDAAGLIDPSIDFQPLFDEVKRAVTEKLAQYQRVADDLPDDWLQSRIDDINRRFDGMLGELRAKYVSNGLYNGTVWASVERGVEHERAHALDAVHDENAKMRLAAYGDISKVTAGVYQQMIDAQVRIFEALQNQKVTPINLRNTVLKWMYEFMERRNDIHPKIEELATVATRLGYDGGVGFPGE